jgi:hypothetical protein
MVDNNVGSLVVIDVDDDGVSGRPLGISDLSSWNFPNTELL